METYARELIPRLAAIDGVEPTAFVNRETADTGEGPWFEIPNQTVPVRARNRMQWVRGEQQHLPRMAARAGCELVHSLGSTSPLRGPFLCVTTIHDINYKLVPEAHFGVLRLGMGVLVPASARRSHRIVVDAHATAADLERHLRVPAGKIDVVPLGVSQEPPIAVTPEPRLRQELALGEAPILLSVSAKRPHKNLLRLIEAHAQLDPGSRPLLVVPGYPTPHEAELMSRARALGTVDQVRFPAWVSAADLEGLYAASEASCSHRCTRALGCPCSRRCDAACPLRARTGRPCPRWRGTLRCSSTRRTRSRFGRHSSACSTTPA